MSEISGIQLNRLLVLATRIDPRPNPALAFVHDLVVAEFSRMEREGIFSFRIPGSRAF
jgi:LysR family nitrogen assimilation transcriptional regulator